MLVLQRSAGQSIRIGDDIEVVVVRVKGQRAHLGFRCGEDVVILRRELPRYDTTVDGDPERDLEKTK